MKKIKYSDTDIPKILINKMMEKYNVTVEELEKLENHQINGVNWFDYYTWTQKEEDEYRRWFCQFFTKNIKPKLPMNKILQMYSWFILDRGLRVSENG